MDSDGLRWTRTWPWWTFDNSPDQGRVIVQPGERCQHKGPAQGLRFPAVSCSLLVLSLCPWLLDVVQAFYTSKFCHIALNIFQS